MIKTEFEEQKMVAYAKQTYTTPAEYLYWERKADNKHEYLGGIVVAMAGASKEHNRASVNLVTEIQTQIKRKPCETFTSDMRLRIPKTNRYYYPDIMIVCGEAEFELVLHIYFFVSPL